MKRKILGLLAAALLAGPMAANAALIVEVPGPAAGGSGNRVFATSWTQTGTYTNVAITAELFGIPQSGVTATAWLTTTIGSGATAADQIATTSVSSNNIFSGLTLGPLTYFLVISISSGSNIAGWSSTFFPSPSTASDVTIGSSFFGDFLDFPAYGPSANLLAVSPTQLLYRVDGTAVTSVPEPGTLALLGLGLVGMGMRRRIKAG